MTDSHPGGTRLSSESHILCTFTLRTDHHNYYQRLTAIVNNGNLSSGRRLCPATASSMWHA